MDLEESLFIKKAKNKINEQLGQLENILDNPNLLTDIRKLTRFVDFETPIEITNALSGYLLDSYTLRITEPSINLGNNEHPHAVKYLDQNINKKEILSYPPQIGITTATSCTRRCPSCIQGQREIGDHIMNQETWNNVMAQLKEMGSEASPENLPQIYPYWYNEPLKDKRINRLLDDLGKEGMYVHLISNGDLIDEKTALDLSKRCHALIITTKGKEIYSKLKHFNERNEYIFCLDHSSFNEQIMGYNRCGSVYQEKKDSPKRCLKGPDIHIDYTGDLYLCCHDMAGQLSVGNVQSDSIIDVWRSKFVQNIQKQLLDGTYNGKPCKHCETNF
ncbi:MAG: SPASM domain-containing protein [Nanobdellota archaeon]